MSTLLTSPVPSPGFGGRARLHGSIGNITWANEIRYRILHTAYTTLVRGGHLTDAAFDTQITIPARHIDHAQWWLDNRDCPTDELSTRLASAR